MVNHFHQVINAVVPAKYLDNKTIYHLQPSGRFVIGGPQVIITHKLITLENTKPSTLTPILAHLTPWLSCGTGGCRCDRQEDHRGHIRRVGGSWRWSILRERLLKGWPLCCLRRSLGGQVSGQSQTVQESSGSGELQGFIRCADEQRLNRIWSIHHIVFLSLLRRFLMPSVWPSLCPSPCSPTVPPRKQSQSCCRLSTRTLICGQESLSGRTF